MIVIRLKKTGKKNRKEWRIVVTEQGAPRNGEHIEELGSANPLVNPPKVKMNIERYEAWIKKGAQPSVGVRGLVREARLESRQAK